ncbi:MAG: hypothetical protein KGI89_13535, partial [Euryarchaeota archaeon]|nr:hypothetical protein [Euryarchaeota archaeon]
RLQRESPQRPMLLLLDDMQWADAETLVAFQFLGRSLRKLSVLLVAAYRDDEAAPPGTDGVALVDVLDRLEREGHLRPLALKGLTFSEGRKLVEDLVGRPLADSQRGALQLLMRRSNGNPYFLLEMVRSLQSEGRVRVQGPKALLRLPATTDEDAAGTPRPDSVPPAIARLLRSRLASERPELREVIDAAAVLGSEFEVAPLAHGLGTSRESVGTVLLQLHRAGRLVLQRPGDPDRYAFQHALLWEVSRDEVPSDRARALSRAYADWWAQFRSRELETIARLYHAAGERTPGLPWIERALRRSFDAGTMETTRRLLRWAQDLFRGDPQGTDGYARLVLATVRQLYFRGSLWQCSDLLKGVLATELSGELRLWAERYLSEAIQTTDFHEARRILEELQEAQLRSPERFSRELEAEVRLVEASLLYHEDRLEEASAAAEAALERLGTRGDAFHRAKALEHLAKADIYRGRYAEGQRRLDQAITLAAESAVPQLRIRLAGTQGSFFMREGRLVEAQNAFELQVAQARVLGHLPSLVQALNSLSHVLENRADWDGAWKAAEEARQLAERLGLTRAGVEARASQAVVLVEMGRWSEALPRLSDVRDRASQVGVPQYVTIADLLALEARGALGEAKGALQELAAREPSVDLTLPDNRALFLRIRGFLRVQVGDREGSEEDLKEALEISERVPLRISRAGTLDVMVQWQSRFGDARSLVEARERADRAFAEIGSRRVDRFSAAGGPPPGRHPLTRPGPWGARARTRAEAPPTPTLSTAAPLSHRILQHLAGQGAWAGAIEHAPRVPPSITQEGFGQALGVSQGSFAKALVRLEERGLVRHLSAHVEGGGRRRLAYYLTPQGESVAREIQPDLSEVRASLPR